VSGLRIVNDPHAPESLKQVVRDHLDTYNVAVTGLPEYSSVSIFLKDSNDEVLGGVLGSIWGGWVHIAFLWVAEPLRRQGHGRTLLEAAERYAVERGCHAAQLETFSFQAPDFYAKHGYEVFSVLDGWPPGHTKYFLRKRRRRGSVTAAEAKPLRGPLRSRRVTEGP